MALYRNTSTGALHRTVDGSRQDRRLSASDSYAREGGGDEGRSLAAQRDPRPATDPQPLPGDSDGGSPDGPPAGDDGSDEPDGDDD